MSAAVGVQAKETELMGDAEGGPAKEAALRCCMLRWSQTQEAALRCGMRRWWWVQAKETALLQAAVGVQAKDILRCCMLQ
jgi:hypothetical protein